MNFSQFLDSVIPQSDLIALAETYHGRHLPVIKLLIPEFPRFRGIFYEIPANYQTDVNYYLKTGKWKKALVNFILGTKDEEKYVEKMTTLIFGEAKKNKLPIICFDSSKVENTEYTLKASFEDEEYYLKGSSRDEDMATTVLKSLRRHPGKWLLIGGGIHIKRGIDYKSGITTMGEELTYVLRDRYLSACLINLADFKGTKALGEEVNCFDVRGVIDPNLLSFMNKNDFGPRDEEDKLYYDFYIIHPPK